MEIYSHADPYKCYLHHPTPEVGKPGYKCASLDEYYAPHSNAKVVDEIRRLFKGAFRTRVIFGQRHFAPSASWRDEHVATQSGTGAVEPSRFAVRVHVYEERAAEGEIEDRAGRYLGFVALRPEDHPPDDVAEGDDEAGFDHVVEAEVTGPSHMQRPRYHLIMTTASSARMGVLPFRSAVYMAPRRTENRSSTCMHLAISQALHLVMSRFGCRPISQREFDAYVWKLRCGKLSKEYDDKPPPDISWPMLKHVGAGDVTDGTGSHAGGARLIEALEVMSACSAGGFIAHFSEDSHGDRSTAVAEAWRCLTDVLANGLPVVVMVNHGMLAQSMADRPHAQLVFGMRLLHCQHKLTPDQPWEDREDRAELPGEFIGHDVINGPFFETPALSLLEAAWDATKFEKVAPEDQMPGINFLVVGPRALKVDLRVVRDYARQYMFSLATQQSAGATLLMEYYTAAKLPAAWLEAWRSHDTDWRYVTRFLGREELLNRPGLAAVFNGGLPEGPCFWVVEVWHPQESHGVRASEVQNPPPPVLVWSNASEWQKSVTDGEPQRGMLHWDFSLSAWVPAELHF